MQKPAITLQWVTQFHLGCLTCGTVFLADERPDLKPGDPCTNADCYSSSGQDGLDAILEAAEEHGRDSEPDHEVGDLQDALMAAWKIMTPAQRAQLLADSDVKEDLEQANGELPESRPLLESLPDVYVVTQEGGATGELYVHTFRSQEEADAYRKSCVEDGSYRTSPPVKLTGLLPHTEGFHEMVEQIVRATAAIDYP